MANRIEVFTADCPLCKDTMKIVREVCTRCEIIERRCSGDVCCDEGKAYGIRSVPTIVLNGKTVFVGRPTREEVKRFAPCAN